MQTYNPFDKSINELNTEDLNTLRTVTEGWYIEYKQEQSKPEAIAKSISALANSYGGWLFYGIAEESKENSVAGTFIGINRSDVDAALQRIRQSVSSMLSPACRYEAKALYGPSETLSLSADKAIICVAVPQSIEAPHIHKKGLIYRRIADGSEPVAENDRHMIEKMFDRSAKIIENFKEWVAEDPELSKGEAEIPHIRLIISTNPWKMPRSDFQLNIESARCALGANGDVHRTIPFDTFYSSSRGVIARQCNNANPTTSRLTWQIYRSLSGDISIPLNLIENSPKNLSSLFVNYAIGEKLATSLLNAKIDRARLVDLNILFHVISGIIQSQRALLKQAGWPREFDIKVKVINSWRTTPFLDTEFYLKHIEKNGIPLCLTNECINPPGNHPDTFIKIKEPPSDDDNDEKVQVTLQAIRAFVPIAEAFGIPLSEIWLNEQNEDSQSNKRTIYEDLIRAGKNAAWLASNNQIE